MSIATKKLYILDNANELIIDDRKEVLQMIYNSQARSSLREKGSGVQIKIEFISDDLINTIYDFIYIKLKDQYLDFS